MRTVLLRFYEELCDYLPEGKKKCAFRCRFEGAVTVAALLRAIGVPLCDVDLIVMNGVSADPAQTVRDGERISVYPVFESIDIYQVSRVRSEPLRRPRFVAGPGLKRLAACLRLLGFDTLVLAPESEGDIVGLAEVEKRILLCRHEEQTRAATRVLVITAASPRLQAAEVLRRLDLRRLVRPFGRCPRCNAHLQPVRSTFSCAVCGKSYRDGERLHRILARTGSVMTRPPT